MHILVITSFFEPHGGAFCLQQAKALKDKGHEVRMITCTQLGLSVDRGFYFTSSSGRWWESRAGVPCYWSFVRGVPFVQFIPSLSRVNMSQWVRCVWSMYEDYSKQYGKPDVIHAHCAKWAGVAAREIAQKEGIPYYITEHQSSTQHRDLLGIKQDKNGWAKQLLRKAFEDARCVITVSDELVEDLKPLFGDSYCHKTISNIVDIDYYVKPEEEQPCSDEKSCRPFRFVCLSRADIYGKGLDVLNMAIQDDWLKNHHAELHFAGADRKALDGLFNQPEVKFYGFLNKASVRELLWYCDALVLPTRCESQSLVVMEAICAGIPVVTTEAVPVSVRVPGACIIVPIGDKQQLAAAMERVMTIGRNTTWRNLIRKIASAQVVATQLEQLFAEK